MKNDTFATAAALSDRDLLARLCLLAAREREATAELVAHLAELDARPAVYSAQGFGSLFAYCREALRLSEDAACNRIEAARACRRFPIILDLLATGAISLSAVRLLAPHLTPENHEGVLGRVRGRRRREIEALIAELAPQADVAASVRRLPLPTPARAATSPREQGSGAPTEPLPALPAPQALHPAPRPIVQASAPARYRVQFTVGEKTHEKLRRLQDLLRREIPDGDPGVIFDRALTLLLDKVERAKLGTALRSRTPTAIRPGADKPADTPASRHIPREVRRVVWRRDGSRCAFVGPTGLRCTEQTFLELHHLQAYALKGPATVANVALRCRRHNQYEAELLFGPRKPGADGTRPHV